MTLSKVHYQVLRENRIAMYPKIGAAIELNGKSFGVAAYNREEPLVMLDDNPANFASGKRWESTLLANGFPKAGTHLLLQVIRPISEPCTHTKWGVSTRDKGWGVKFPVTRVIAQIRSMQAGQGLGGHIAADEPQVRNWLKSHRVPMIFIYRDLRDVVVSYAYHVAEPDDKRWRHTDKTPYRELPDHEARIAAAITGIGPYLSIAEYWSEYHRWLHTEGVCCVRYEDARWDLLGECQRMIDFLDNWRATNYTDMERMELAQWLANALMPSLSVTFRRGRVGDWRREFTPELKNLFKEVAGQWLIRTGYEQGLDW